MLDALHPADLAPRNPAPPASREVAAPRLRIRTGHSYHIDYTITLGQRNARFVQRALTPLARLVSWTWVDSVTFVPEPGFDAIHSWNAVPLLTAKPYVITFEDYLPRTPDDRKIARLERWLRARLLDPRCVGLVATSHYARRQVGQQHRGWEGLPNLLAKIEVIHPACPTRREAPKPHSDCLRLLFVGRDFMRKGGPVVLRAHAALRRAGVPVETTVVSSLGWSPEDYIGPPDRSCVDRELAGLAAEGVTHHRSLPLDRVYALMDAADYLVFPTFHDTFGFVAIEALAGGTPVIATETCALPEVVIPDETGWLLPFENDADVGKWRWMYRNDGPGYVAAYVETTERLSQALADRLTAAWEGRGDYERLSAGALRAARTRFNPELARARLEAIYDKFGLTP